jgi:NTE family protein
MRAAFVLSGGGSLGASQAGMVQALYERGVRPDLLVGTSARAVNAGLIASRPPTPQTAADLQRVWRGLGRSDVFPPIRWSRDWGSSACAPTAFRTSGACRRHC